MVGCHPTKQTIAGLIPGKGTCLGCEFSPWSGQPREFTVAKKKTEGYTLTTTTTTKTTKQKKKEKKKERMNGRKKGRKEKGKKGIGVMGL